MAHPFIHTAKELIAMADCMYCDPQDVRRLELMTPIAPLEA